MHPGFRHFWDSAIQMTCRCNVPALPEHVFRALRRLLRSRCSLSIVSQLKTQAFTNAFEESRFSLSIVSQLKAWLSQMRLKRVDSVDAHY